MSLAHLPPARRRLLATRARRTRRGFTLPEILIVVTMMGAMLGYGMPKMNQMRNRNRLRAARDELAAMISTARAAAIQKGRASRFNIVADSAFVTVDTTSVASQPKLVVVANRQMQREYGVKLSHAKAGTTSWTTASMNIPFDSRGFANTPDPEGEVILITGFQMRDSICVTHFGMVTKRGCVQ